MEFLITMIPIPLMFIMYGVTSIFYTYKENDNMAAHLIIGLYVIEFIFSLPLVTMAMDKDYGMPYFNTFFIVGINVVMFATLLVWHILAHDFEPKYRKR